jgi:hypothetical protein
MRHPLFLSAVLTEAEICEIGREFCRDDRRRSANGHPLEIQALKESSRLEKGSLCAPSRFALGGRQQNYRLSPARLALSRSAQAQGYRDSTRHLSAVWLVTFGQLLWGFRIACVIIRNHLRRPFGAAFARKKGL